MKDEYSRNIELLCPVCGESGFQFDDEVADGDVTCIRCSSVFTRSELMEANQENVSIHVDEVKEEVLSDVRAEFQAMFKKKLGK